MNKHFDRNTTGRDFVVSDIHGCFTMLQEKLDAIGFNEQTDRLFSVGDLVDRGPESEQCLDWLAKPWFHCVLGNHEVMAIECAAGEFDWQNYILNGGAWMLAKIPQEKAEFALAFLDLPITMTVETAQGQVGIVHAECILSDWDDLQYALMGENSHTYLEGCLWSRERITNHNHNRVAGVHAVVCGHTPLQDPVTLGNTYFIDTGACFGNGRLTVLDLATLTEPEQISESMTTEQT